MASNKKDDISRHLTTRVTRRQVMKAGGIAALGLAFTKPVVETLRPKTAWAQVSPVGHPRSNVRQPFSDVFTIPQQFATIEEAAPTVVMPFDGIIKTGTDQSGNSLRGLIQFDVSFRIGATINRAEFFLFNLFHDTVPSGEIIPHTLHRVTSPWVGPAIVPPPVGDATWSAHRTAFTTSPSDPSTDIDSSAVYSWDITEIVRLWASGVPNYGVMLIGDESMMFQDSFIGNPGPLPFPAAKLEIDGTTGGTTGGTD